MSLTSDELLFAAGGDVWEKYGTFVKRTLPEEERGSFSRSSDATFRDRSEVLRTAESGVKRPHWVPSESSFAARLEASRTNRYTRSEDLSHGDWTKTNVSITTDDADGADGSTTADKVVENNDSANEHLVTQSLPTSNISDDTDQTASCHGVDAERKWLAIRTTDQNGDTATSWVDLSDGSTGTVASAHTVRVETDWNGLVRPAVTFDSDSGGTTPTVEWIVTDADGSTSYDGDGSSGLHLWGFQYEADSTFPSSYIQTTDSAVSRAADDLSFPISFGPQELTVYVKAKIEGLFNNSVPNNVLALLGQDPSNFFDGPRFLLRSTGGNGFVVEYEDGSNNSLTQILSGADLDIGDIVEFRGVMTGSPVGSKVVAEYVDQTDSVQSGTKSNTSGSIQAESSWAKDKVVLTDDTRDSAHSVISGPIIAPGVRTMDEMRSIEL